MASWGEHGTILSTSREQEMNFFPKLSTYRLFYLLGQKVQINR